MIGGKAVGRLGGRAIALGLEERFRVAALG